MLTETKCSRAFDDVVLAIIILDILKELCYKNIQSDHVFGSLGQMLKLGIRVFD